MKSITATENTYHFGLLLAEILRKKRIKQKELSELTGFSESYISQVLSEKRTPELKTLKVICDALQIRLSYFLMKSIMEEELEDGANEEFIEKHIKPALEELNKLVYKYNDFEKVD